MLSAAPTSSVLTNAPGTSQKSLSGVAADPTFYVWDGAGWRVATPAQEAAQVAAETADYREDALAFNAIRSGDLAGARSKLSAILRRRPYDDTAAAYLGDVCVRMGLYPEALAVLGPLLSVTNSEDVLLRAAVAGAMVGHVFPGQVPFANHFSMVYAGALTGVKESIAAAPPRVSALAGIGSSYLMKGDYPTAQIFFERAREEDPGNPFVEYTLGDIYLAAKRYSDAKRAYSVAAARGLGDVNMFASRQAGWITGQLNAGVQPAPPTRTPTP